MEKEVNTSNPELCVTDDMNRSMITPQRESFADLPPGGFALRRHPTLSCTFGKKHRSDHGFLNDSLSRPTKIGNSNSVVLSNKKKGMRKSYCHLGETYSPLLALRQLFPGAASQMAEPTELVKERWKRARNILKAIRRLAYLAKEIQLYGSPAFAGDEYHFKRMVHSVKKGVVNSPSQEVRKKSGNVLVLLPDSQFKLFWSFLLTFLMIYSSFISPLRLAFLDVEEVNGTWAVQVIVDTLFAIDIVVNCCSAYYDETNGKLITNHRKIFIEYARFWLWIDVLACFPFSEIFVLGGVYDRSKSTDFKQMRMEHMLRLYELIKSFSVFKMLKGGKQYPVLSILTDVIQMNSSNFWCVTIETNSHIATGDIRVDHRRLDPHHLLHLVLPPLLGGFLRHLGY